MKRYFALILLTLITTNSYATKIDCIGFDSANNLKKWHIYGDNHTHKLLVNGHAYEIESTKNDKDKDFVGIYTKDFESDQNNTLYNALIYDKKKNKYYLIQYEAKTHKYWGSIDLLCTFSEA